MVSLNYNLENGLYGSGDLSYPKVPNNAPIVLLIHGGGWSAGDIYSISGIAEFFNSLGWAVFNIEYRLTTQAPWPACGDDCIEAANFLLNSNIPELATLNRDKILICGASAGGHLALMTGLRLPKDKLLGIISISGITDINIDYITHSPRYDNKFFTEPINDKLAKQASPIEYITTNMPPLLLTHWRDDQVVTIPNARNFYEKSKALGNSIELYEYENSDYIGHGIWIEGSNPHKLYSHIEAKLEEFAKTINPQK